MSYLRLVSAERIAGVGVANLSHPAFVRGLLGLGKPNAIPKLSGGQYGLAMSHVAIPAEAIRLLLLSKTFQHMAEVLDRAYVDDRYWRWLKADNASSKVDNNFRIAGGSLKGRRILYVYYDDYGSRFTPAGAASNAITSDIIEFKTSLQKGGPIPWVEDVAHETAHAVARVTARGRGPSTAVQRVRAAVLDECNAREVEQQVLAEIRTTKAGKAALAEYPPPSPVDLCDCEREFFPVAQKRTYLEQFVLGMDWEVAAKQLIDKNIEKITADVAAIPLHKRLLASNLSIFLIIMRGGRIGIFDKQFPVLQSAAGQAAFVLRLVDESWLQLIGRTGENPDTWLGARELRLQRHARLFFKIPVSYTTKCPMYLAEKTRAET